MNTKGSISGKSRPVGEILVSSGLITKKQLDEALAYKHKHKVKVGQALVALNMASEADLANALKTQGKLHCLQLSPAIVDPFVARQLGEDLSRQLGAIAINKIAGIVTVAMEDPLDICAVDDISRHLGVRVLTVHAETTRIEECLEGVFRRSAADSDGDDLGVGLNEIVSSAGLEIEDFDPDSLDTEALKDDGSDNPVIKLIQGILHEALAEKTSDIHLECRANSFLVRFRVDGALFNRLSLPKGWARPCLARLKVISKLDIAQRRLPQDGRAQIDYKGRPIDARIATTPSLHGEGAVIRILDSGNEAYDIGSLGLDERQRAALDAVTDCSDGIVLATGPTGSGKTTTLYAMLKKLSTPDRKIITLEDPVEYQLEGATQINTNAKIDLTFARGLRSILRQDPDVVLVGEIRDTETAEIAVKAALTGHMLLSTLHTVGTAESIVRLQEMGIEPYLLTDTLRGIVAQRLVRRICLNCKEPCRADPRVLKRLGLEGEDHVYYRGSGCEQCHGTGYSGRLGLYEVMVMNEDMCEVLRRHGGTNEMRQVARAQGMSSLRDGGIRRARRGETTLEEVLSATARGEVA